MPRKQKPKRPPFVCIPWEEKRKELAAIRSNEELVKKVWEDTDALAYVYIWQCLLSF
jgi:methoxylated aromatic compound---corrinoid protein Co-methyltransferase